MAKKTKDSNLSIEERLEQALIPNWDEPYKLPENWCWVRSDAIASIYTGNSINERVKEEKYSGRTNGLVYLATKDIDFDSTIDYDTNVCIPQSDGFKVAPKHSTLLCIEGGSAGRKIGFITQDVCFVNKLCAFVPHDKINPKYLYYAIQSDTFKKQFDAKKHGLIGGVSVKEVSSIFIPFAPIEIQNKIVELIESVFNKLDEAKEKAQEVVDGFETRKAAILYKAFSGELTAEWREENGVSLDEWEHLTLDDVADYKKGPFGSSITKAMFVPKSENTYKVYEQGNAIRKILDYGSYYISQKKYEELKGFAIKPGDIIVSCAGTIGEIYKLPNNCEAGVINQALMRVRVYSNINEMYFIHYFTGVLKGDVIDEANGTAIKNIPPFKVLKAMNIFLPPLFEQNKIVEILERMLSKEQVAKETAERVIEQIDTIKKAILARAFRGDLGTNNPSEESAVELLKQVLNTVTEQKKTVKRTVIPKSLESRIKTDLERKIIRLYIQNEVSALTIDLIMSVSSKKFDIMEALRNLQQRGILEKENDKYKLLE